MGIQIGQEIQVRTFGTGKKSEATTMQVLAVSGDDTHILAWEGAIRLVVGAVLPDGQCVNARSLDIPGNRNIFPAIVALWGMIPDETIKHLETYGITGGKEFSKNLDVAKKDNPYLLEMLFKAIQQYDHITINEDGDVIANGDTVLVPL